MITTLVAPRALARTGGALARVGAVTTRNLVAIRHSGYWLVVLAGFVEPVLYLFAIGLGVGRLVPTFTLDDGSVVQYGAFVAPAMLAAAAMSGAMAESTFNFFARMKWAKLYDTMVTTPLRPIEIAMGELGWAMLRGAMYAAAFLGLMVWLDLTTIGWAILALPASVLVGFTFGALGMAISTALRTWQDIDYILVVQFALFLFSGTFVPVEAYPPVMRVIVEATPLYHSVELIRDITLARASWGSWVHVLYLTVLTVTGLAIAGRRMNTILCK